MSVCGCLYPEISDEIRLWGESYLALDNAYRRIGDQLFSFLPEEELTSMYASRGRSSINPIILSFVTIFQYLEDIPDRVAALWVKTRLDWKYALHLPLEDGGFHYADLCNFRKRLLVHGKESLLFEELLKQIESLGFLKKRGSQRTDSTHVLAVVQQLSRLENLSEGLRMALKAIQEADGAFYKAKLPALYREHWSKPLSDYQRTDDERKAALERVGQDMHCLSTPPGRAFGFPETQSGIVSSGTGTFGITSAIFPAFHPPGASRLSEEGSRSGEREDSDPPRSGGALFDKTWQRVDGI